MRSTASAPRRDLCFGERLQRGGETRHRGPGLADTDDPDPGLLVDHRGRDERGRAAASAETQLIRSWPPAAARDRGATGVSRRPLALGDRRRPSQAAANSRWRRSVKPRRWSSAVRGRSAQTRRAPTVCGGGPLRGAHAVSGPPRIADARHAEPRPPAYRHWYGRHPSRCGSAALGPRAELLGWSRRVRGAPSTRPPRRRDLRPGRSLPPPFDCCWLSVRIERGCRQARRDATLNQDCRTPRRAAARPGAPTTGALGTPAGNPPSACTRVRYVWRRRQRAPRERRGNALSR